MVRSADEERSGARGRILLVGEWGGDQAEVGGWGRVGNTNTLISFKTWNGQQEDFTVHKERQI